MPLIQLVTPHGQYLAYDRTPTPHLLLTERPAFWDSHALPSGAIHLTSPAWDGPPLELAFADDGPVVQPCGAQLAELFLASSDGARSIVRDGGGRILCTTDDPRGFGYVDTLIADDAQWLVVPEPAAALRREPVVIGTGCHVHGDGGVGVAVWERGAHEQITMTAMERLIPALEARWGEFGVVETLRKASPVFIAGVKAGLLAADYESPYKDWIFSWHFYDPDDRRGYNPLAYSARDKGASLFVESAASARSILRRHGQGAPIDPSELAACGRLLGLALHFVTDLTQPMHASNFTSGSNPPMLHSRFEEWVDRELAHEPTFFDTAPAPSDAQLEATRRAISDGSWRAGPFLHDLAMRSKAVWRENLDGRRSFEFHRSERGLTNVFEQAIRVAPRDVANFLHGWCLWIRTGEVDLDTTRWYRLGDGSVLNEFLTEDPEGSNWVRRWRSLSGEDRKRQEFCFQHVAGGKWVVVSRRRPTHGFRIEAGHWGWWYLELNHWNQNPHTGPGGNPFEGIADSKRRMSFVIDRSPGADHKIRFYEATKDEVLTTSWGRTDGYVHRDTDRPDDPRQSYHLVPGEFIDPTELATLRDFWR